MDTKQILLARYVCTKILDRLRIFAQHNAQSLDPMRGATIFGKNADPGFSNKFYVLLIECMFCWPKVYMSCYQFQQALE